MAFALGFLYALNLAVAGAVAYILYMYVYRPWKVMRADLVALDGKLNALHAEMNAAMSARRVDALSDAEVAFRENQLLAKSRARAAQKAVP